MSGYAACAIAALPALALWLFVGAWVCVLAERIVDGCVVGETSDDDRILIFVGSLLWPLVLVLIVVPVVCFRLFAVVTELPRRMFRESKVPEARVVSK